MNNAFKALQEEATVEYGTDPYNGTISTISELRDKTREFLASGLSTEAYFDGLIEDLGKREAVGVCLREPVAGKPGRYAFAGWAAE